MLFLKAQKAKIASSGPKIRYRTYWRPLKSQINLNFPQRKQFSFCLQWVWKTYFLKSPKRNLHCFLFFWFNLIECFQKKYFRNFFILVKLVMLFNTRKYTATICFLFNNIFSNLKRLTWIEKSNLFCTLIFHRIVVESKTKMNWEAKK